MIMECYKQVIAPTAVTSSVSLPFLSPSANNLVVAKTSLLQIFALKSVVSEARDDALPTSQHDQGKSQRRERTHLTKLVLISEFQVAGQITSLARVSSLPSKTGGDLLLVALKDAKLSLVEWDPERYTISTISIHYYEQEDLRTAPWSPPSHECQTSLLVDPSNRCAAFKFGARQIAILPLAQTSSDDLVMDDYDVDVDPNSRRRHSSKTKGDAHPPTTQSTSFVLSLLTLDPALIHPVDLAFLHEYREPTIGILSSAQAASSALLAVRRDCISYTVYTLDLEQRASTTLLSVQGLPYDVNKIVPLPLPIGGALLIGPNEFIHVDQGGRTNGLAVNEFAKQASSFALVSQAELGIKLDDCQVEHLGGPSGELLIFLNTGALVILHFRIEGRSVSGLFLETVPASSGGSLLQGPVSCCSTVGRGRLFVGSEHADSVILGWSSRSQLTKRKQSTIGAATREDELQLDSEFESVDDDDLYGDSKAEKADIKTGVSAPSEIRAGDCVFKFHDTLKNLAPLSGLSVVPLGGDGLSDTAPLHNARAQGQLLAVSGVDRSSKLVRLSPNVPLQANKRLKVESSSRLWSLQVKNLTSDTIPGKDADFHNVVVTSAVEETEAGSSQVYVLKEEELQPLEAGDFESDAGSSVEVFTLLGGMRVVQVLPTEVRAFDGGEFLLLILVGSSYCLSMLPFVIPRSYHFYLLFVRVASLASIFLRASFISISRTSVYIDIIQPLFSTRRAFCSVLCRESSRRRVLTFRRLQPGPDTADCR